MCLFFSIALYQYVNLLIWYDWEISFLAGSNSSVSFSNASNPTSSNGIGSQLTNTTNTSSNPVALNSTHAPTTRKLTTTENLTQPGVIDPLKTGKSPSAAISPTESANGAPSEKPVSTKPVVKVSSAAKLSDDEGNSVFSKEYNYSVTVWLYKCCSFGNLHLKL